MDLDVRQIEQQALRLPIDDRFRLTELLLSSLGDKPLEESGLDETWIREAERRLEELQSGQVPGIPLNEATDWVRASLRRRP